MLASSGLRPRNSSRGHGPTRANLRHRGNKAVRGGSRNAAEISAPGTSLEVRGGWRACPGGTARSNRQTTPAKSQDIASRQPIQRPSARGYFGKSSGRTPASLNAAFQSHAGKATNPQTPSWRSPPFEDPQLYNKQMNDLYSTLKQNRERERKQAIKDGCLADPDKPTILANAITPVGTCEDMCPEFERVERIVQLMVDGREKISVSSETKERVAFEDIMVKRFRRSAAGYDEQLPSDIRPPTVLKKVLDYLFNDVVGGPEPLATVHKFVWDRTRSVRNDFSIQQVTKVEDLKIAIDCFERIARFHILSLHQLSDGNANGDNIEFDAYQEREQLNNTLLSLQYYYDDSRQKLVSPNEAEFRSYGIIFEIQDQRPDIEDRLQSLPRNVLKNRRVQTAILLHAVAGNIADEQGPLRPRTHFLTAQANFGGFWSLIQSNAVSYLMACVAEIYFNVVRRTALNAIWKAYRAKRPGPGKMEDWTIEDLTHALGFDDEAQTIVFCEQHGFTIADKASQEQYIDLGSVVGGSLTDQNPRRKQIFSKFLVETKRLGRTLPSIIDGIGASQVQAQGLVDDDDEADGDSTANREPLFIDGDSDERTLPSPKTEDAKDFGGEAPKSNPAGADFSPLPESTAGLFNNVPAFEKSTFGKPSSNPFTSKAPQTSPSTFISASEPLAEVNSALPNGNDYLKKNFFAPYRSNEPKNEAIKDTTRPPNLNFNFTTTEGTSRVISSDESSKNNSIKLLDLLPNTNSQKQNPDYSGLNATPSFSIATANRTPSIFDQLPDTSSPSAFSFGTSPLFSTTSAEQGSGIDAKKLSSRPIDEPSKIPFSSSTQADKTGSPGPLSLPNSISSLNGPTSRSSTQLFTDFSSKPASGLATVPALGNSEISGTGSTRLFASSHPESDPSSSLSSSSAAAQQTVSLPKPDTGDLFKPNATSILSQSSQYISKPQHDVDVRPQSVPDPQLSSQDTEASQVQIEPRTITDSTSTVLDHLSDAIMNEEKGVLQQFIEFIVEPIIKSSLAQLDDEDSWKQAHELRGILLSKKYGKKWRAIAWNKSLMRKGRNRRSNFNQSINELARSMRQKRSDTNSHMHTAWTGSKKFPSGMIDSPSTVPLSSSVASSSHLLRRQSMIDPSHETVNGTKRKRNDSVADTFNHIERPAKLTHRRQQSFDTSTMSAPQRSLPHKRSHTRIDASQVAVGSMLNDVLMKQARQVVPTAKSDTTRTDYFRLKALGVDPDTPAVPVTRKRVTVQATQEKDTKRIRSSPLATTPMLTLPTAPRTVEPCDNVSRTSATIHSNRDNGETLFAQIRSVREALAESEQWFQFERQSIESSSDTPQHGRVQSPHQPASTESAAQRKLREIKERGPTPSRTELRLRSLGGQSLLPEWFWDGDSTGSNSSKVKRKEKEHKGQDTLTDPEERQKPKTLIGFAAMPRTKGGSCGDVQRHDSGALKAGSSVEDAIEL